MNHRQLEQKTFDEGNQNLIVGLVTDCPIPPEHLALLTAESPYVVEVFESGLTAKVFHLNINGRHFTLKQKRTTAKVQNLDGQYSFLNEVQRRHDLQKLKDTPETSAEFSHIVSTIYADYRQGIILSDWIEGETMPTPDKHHVSQLFSTLLACEKAGLFEWDLCQGNAIIDPNNQLWLFDFGYMYRFNPLTELNSNGIADPLFNFCERFETRFVSGWFATQNTTKQEALAVFRMIKLEALTVFQKKLEWLKTNQATCDIVDYHEAIISKYQQSLRNSDKLEALFTLEMFRSHVLDIEDDLDGKSCSPQTIQRLESVIVMIREHYDVLNQHGGLFYHNQGKSQAELIQAYLAKEQLVQQYQI